MVPTTKEDLAKMITQTTREVYEELTPQLIMVLEQTKKNEQLTLDQRQDEIMLDMMGFVKSCTNEIIIEVLAEILGIE